MLGALLTEIAIVISRVTLIQERHLIAVSYHAGEEARREALTQLGKQHWRIILNLEIMQRHQRRWRDGKLTLVVSTDRVPGAPPLVGDDLTAIDRNWLI